MKVESEVQAARAARERSLIMLRMNEANAASLERIAVLTVERCRASVKYCREEREAAEAAHRALCGLEESENRASGI